MLVEGCQIDIDIKSHATEKFLYSFSSSASPLPLSLSLSLSLFLVYPATKYNDNFQIIRSCLSRIKKINSSCNSNKMNEVIIK